MRKRSMRICFSFIAESLSQRAVLARIFTTSARKCSSSSTAKLSLRSTAAHHCSKVPRARLLARLTLERESDSCAVEKQEEESMRGSDLRTGELFSYVDLEQ